MTNAKLDYFLNFVSLSKELKLVSNFQNLLLNAQSFKILDLLK